MENNWKIKVESLIGKKLDFNLNNWQQVFIDLQEHIALSDPISSAT
jgi:hypothetical protein